MFGKFSLYYDKGEALENPLAVNLNYPLIRGIGSAGINLYRNLQFRIVNFWNICLASCRVECPASINH